MRRSMKDFIKYIIVWLLGIVGGITLCVWFTALDREAKRKQSEEISVVWRQNHFLLTGENLYNELIAQGVNYPQIVLAQAILETDSFRSYSCYYNNNLFGLRCTNGTYASFEHWTDCVAAYKNSIQNYKNKPDDYYQYLQKLGCDSLYINKLKQITE